MTPERATELIIQAKLEENNHTEYRDALHTIAGMTWEYGVARLQINGQWTSVHNWTPILGDARVWLAQAIDTTTTGQARIVRRMVSKPEVLE